MINDWVAGWWQFPTVKIILLINIRPILHFMQSRGSRASYHVRSRSSNAKHAQIPHILSPIRGNVHDAFIIFHSLSRCFGFDFRRPDCHTHATTLARGEIKIFEYKTKTIIAIAIDGHSTKLILSPTVFSVLSRLFVNESGVYRMD